MMITKTNPGLRRRVLPTLIAACFGAGAALANPFGAQVVNGQASFLNQGNTLSVTNSPGAIINWQNFSINPGEITRFIQQNPDSAVLNRIVGQDPSQILGILQSNGRVFLVNPNGIVFGKGAQINVNALISSTLNISNEDFISGKLNFKAGDKAGNLLNQGTITTPSGGKVYLIAPNVENSGIITSPKGDVLLAAGRSVQLVDSVNPDLQVVVSAPEDQALNLGQIIAQGGKTGIYGALINQRGIVNANSAVVGENGKIVLKASKDTILEGGSQTTATGAGKGGEVQVLGGRVGLTGDAKVDASGQLGGGTVLVGGDYHGENSAVQNAARTYVGPDAVIRADAADKGDGGKVIVWSDDVTRNYGKISARGGAGSGNGGFVESSGKKYLEHHAKVDVGAPKGNGGTLLLDPAAITIVGGSGDGASSPDGNTTFQGGATPGTVNFSDGDLTSAGTSNIYQSELQGMAPGTNIVLEAADYISATGTFSNLVTLPNNSNLTMRTRNASSDGSGTLGINLVGSTDSSNLEFKTQGTGTITLQTGTGASPQFATIDVGKLTTAGGQVSISATGNVVARAVKTTPLAPGVGGNMSITSSGGYLSLGGGNIDARGNSNTSGNVTLSSAGAISLQNTKTIYANQLKMTSATGIYGTASTDAMGTQVNTLNASNSGTGDIRISNSGTNLSIDDIGAIGYGIRQLAGGQGIYVTNATGQSIGINKQIVTNNGAVSLTGPAGVTLTASNPISTGTGNIMLAATDSGAMLSMPAGSQVSSSGGTIGFQADKMSLLGTINAGTGGIAKLAPATANSAIHLATGGTDSTASTLELSAAELNTITASKLLIGDANSGAIDIKAPLNGGTGGALEHITTALKLTSSSAITQQANAIIDGGSSVSAIGSSVTLKEANGTGVISGSTTNGDFQYHSINQINVNTIDGVSGITVPGGANIYLESDYTALGITQASNNPITGGGLALKTKGQVSLGDANNNFTNVAADLNLGATGAGKFFLYNSNNLTAGGTFFGITGITTNNQPIDLKTGAGKTLTISQAISAGTGKVGIDADSLTISTGSITASDVGIHPYSAGRKITVGSATCAVSPCLAIADLYKVSAGTIGIGTTDASKLPGDIAVAGITNGTALATDINNANTTRIGLLTGGNVSQSGPIVVQDLGVAAGGAVTLNDAGNKVSNLAAKTSGGNFSFANSIATTVTTLSGGIAPDNYSMSGIFTGNGALSLSTSAGDIMLAAPLDAGTGAVTLSASNGAISQSSGDIRGGSLSLTAVNGIGDPTALSTKVSSLTASNSGAGKHINISNVGTLGVQNVSQSGAGSNITINNVGATTVKGTVSTTDGSISIKANSPLTINDGSSGKVQSSSGNISLEAGASGSSSDTLTINGSIATASGGGVVVSTTGAITLKAGNTISVTGSTAGNVTQTSNMNAPAEAPPAPSLESCTANPALSGCSAVLPTLSACTATPTLAGCTAVLPTVDACTATPTLSGCSAVLPTLSTCTATPTLAGCTAVLPTVDACTATPTLSGCSAVLPTLSTCTATPTLAGCTAVLPTVNACTATPTLSGCSAVLPTLSACTATPTLAGCTAVLPTVNACAATPTLSGCSAVLPTLSACTATPTLAGCTTVLPTVDACTATPTLTGCSAVLPTLATCTATPTLSGCTAVLPPVDPCMATPTAAGCTASTPTLSQCTINPSMAGCGAVLSPIVSGGSQPASAGSVASVINTAATTTVNTVVAATATVMQSTSTGQGGAVGTDGAGTSSSDSKKSEGKKEEKKDTASPQDNGAKKNDTAKKMYCN